MSFTQTEFINLQPQEAPTVTSTGTASATQATAGGPLQFQFSLYGHNQSAKRKQELYELSRVIHPISMKNINNASNLDEYYNKQKIGLYQNMQNSRNMFEQKYRNDLNREVERQNLEINSMNKYYTLENVGKL
jgi:hypothetical protein